MPAFHQAVSGQSVNCVAFSIASACWPGMPNSVAEMAVLSARLMLLVSSVHASCAAPAGRLQADSTPLATPLPVQLALNMRQVGKPSEYNHVSKYPEREELLEEEMKRP